MSDYKWYRIENSVNDKSVVYLFDEIGAYGIQPQDFVAELSAISAPTIELHINSPGGDVFAACAIHATLSQHPATVAVVVDGLAASSASFIAMAGDTVGMARNATMMIHEPWARISGGAADMRKQADLLDKVSANIADMYMARAGGTVKDWQKRMKAETWFSASEAQAVGLCDEVLEPGATPSAAFDLSVFNYAGRLAAPSPIAAPSSYDVAVAALRGAFNSPKEA